MSDHLHMDYIEFSTRDLPASKKFFSEVFGWKFQDFGDQYSSFNDGRLRGGFAHSDGTVGGGPLVVIHAASLEPVQDKVVTSGGTITLPVFEFPGGKRFHFREPGGNELAVWSK